jgi:succinyl-diaminopimelate desuccinylase
MRDLLAFTAELVAIPSVSRNEQVITDYLEGLLADAAWLELTRIGNNLVAKTQLGRPQRLLLAGHTDTVPGTDGQVTRIDGDVLWGLGAADMKAGVAVLAELARTVAEPAVDVTYVFYECEEISADCNGLRRLATEAPHLLKADAGVLAEPSRACIEVGCQGTMKVVVTLDGVRAHSARPWRGHNAIHRLGSVLQRLDEYEGRRPVLDGCEFREALSAVRVEGGVADNVVPDQAVVVINYRFAPDRSVTEAVEHVRNIVGDVHGFEVVDCVAGATPSLDHPLLASLVCHVASPPEAKLGWTDVATLSTMGVPALNFGPGDPLVAHAVDERVERSQIEAVYTALRRLLEGG